MCAKCEAKRAQDAAAAELERVCKAQLASGGILRPKRQVLIGERPCELFAQRRRRSAQIH